MKNLNEELLELKKEIADVKPYNGLGYPEHIKKRVIDLHYAHNLSLYKIAKMVGVSNPSVYLWKKAIGKERTAFKHGNGVRYDVRTKALAVEKVLENGKAQYEVAVEFGVTPHTISEWLLKYKDNYKELLDLPDGVPYIIREEKHIFGNATIDEMLARLKKQEIELSEKLTEIITKKEDILKAKKVLEDAGITI